MGNNGTHLCCLLILLVSASCGRREPEVREETFLAAEAPVRISGLLHPALVRTSTGGLVMTAFIHSMFPSATEARDAITVHESKDDGATWRELARIPSHVAYGVWGYDLAIDAEDRLYLVWVAAVHNAETRIPLKTVLFSRSDDGGRTWTAPVGVSDAKAGQRRHCVIAVGGGDVYVAWLDGRSAREDVRFASSADRGATWSANTGLERDLSGKDAGSGEPSLCVGADGAVHCAYVSMRQRGKTAGGFWLATSADGGRTFAIDPHGAGALGHMCVTRAGDRLCLAAVAVTGVAIAAPPKPRGEVQFYVSEDGGGDWDGPVRIDDDAQRARKNNVLLVPAGARRRLACWDDHRGGIYMAASIDGGETWGINVRVADRSPVGLTPLDLAADPATGAFHLVVGHVRKGPGDAIYLVKGTVVP